MMLGFDFLESVYEKSLEIKLRKMGYEVIRQHPIEVYFEEELVGEFLAIQENNNFLHIKNHNNQRHKPINSTYYEKQL